MKSPNKKSEEFIDYAGLENFGICIGTAYSLVHQNRIPHYRFGRRFVRFKKSEIETWILEHKVEQRKGEVL